MEQITSTIKEYAIIFVCCLIILVTVSQTSLNPEYKELEKGDRIKKLFIGSVGSCISVVCVYEILLKLFGWDPTLCLALGAATGFIGGEAALRIVLKFLEKKLGIKED